MKVGSSVLVVINQLRKCLCQSLCVLNRTVPSIFIKECIVVADYQKATNLFQRANLVERDVPRLIINYSKVLVELSDPIIDEYVDI